MEVDSEDGCGMVCGVGEHTEFLYDGVRSEFVLGDFPGMMVRNCVPLQSPQLVSELVSQSVSQFI